MSEVKNIKFKGIDDFNRPVFKIVDEDIYVGSVYTLFDWSVKPDDVIAHFKSNTSELEYFGNKFNCEPTGGKLSCMFNIITK
jgi:hypothetical protein